MRGCALVARSAVLVGVLATVVLIAAAAGNTAGSGQARWVITDLGTLSERGSYTTAINYLLPIPINDRGEIVLTLNTRSGEVAFVWRAGKLIRLGFLQGGTSSWAAATNDAGEIVGASATNRGDEWPHAVLWRQGSVTDLGTLGERQSGGPKGSARSWATAINDKGWITGQGDLGGNTHPFVWKSGHMSDLGTLGGGNALARAIDNRGRIIGQSRTKNRQWHAFLWQNGAMTDLGTLPGGSFSEAYAINDRGQVVGHSYTRDDHDHAVLWEKGKMRDLGTLPGLLVDSTAVAINEQGQVVGRSTRDITNPGTDVPSRSFLWDKGRMRDLGSLGGGSSMPEAINESGQIVGWSKTAKGNIRAFLWDGGPMTDLGTLGGSNSSATGINEHNQIVGWSTTKTGQTHAVLWTLRSGA